MILNEERSPVFQTAREKYVQKEIIALLRRNKHNMYADRLDKNAADAAKRHIFYIKIVPLKVDPMYSASMDDENLTIRVGEGFLTDLHLEKPEDRHVFNQLDVIIRHEIAHFYLRHQKRFAKIFPEYDRICKSSSLFNFLNIVADDEISNTRYTEADKKIIRAQKLNGEIVKGLVTEDHREDWKRLTLEQMIELLEKEIEEDNEKLIRGIGLGDERLPKNFQGKGQWNPTTEALLNAYNAYQDIYADSSLPGKDLTAFKKWIEDGCWVNTPRGRIQIAEHYRALIKRVYEGAVAEKLDDNKVDDLLLQIAKSKINAKVYIFTGKNKLDLYTPEEKYMGEEVLKKFRTKSSAWYKKVLEFLNEHNISSGSVSDFWDDKMKG